MRKGLILFGLAMLPATALGAVEPAVHADQREGTMENSAEHNIAVVKQMIAAWEVPDADAPHAAAREGRTLVACWGAEAVGRLDEMLNAATPDRD